MKKFRINVPVILVITILAAQVTYKHIPFFYASLFYSISSTIKSFIIFVLPIVIISSVYNSIRNMHGTSIVVLPAVLFFICFSNFFHVVSSFFIAKDFLHFTMDIHQDISASNLNILWNFQFPKVISNDLSLLIGFFLGMLGYFGKTNMVINKFMKPVDKVVEVILRKIFIPVLPIFIFGMLIKALNQGVFVILYDNISAFSTMFFILIAYMALILLISSGFYYKKLLSVMKNVIEPLITAFSSMSSAVALPFSLKAAKKNTKNKSFSAFYISATANIHMLGDCICIPFLAVIVMKIFAVQFTDSQIYWFAFMFMVTKFSGAGVPGGTILIMTPALEKILSFSPEMIGLITGLYIIIDPITTSASVMGNNIFVIMFDKVINFFKRMKI